MTLNSITFAAFALVAFLGHWLLGVERGRMQNVVLIACSFVFYAWWDPRCLGLLVGVILVAYVGGLGVRNKCYGKTVLVVSIVLMLGLLGAFKYYNFFVDSFSALFGFEGERTLYPILPVGISFYTFMAISYLVDVRSGKVGVERDLVVFTAYMSFFPQLLAGPIGRGAEMLPQFSVMRRFDYALAVDGCRQFLWGAFAKIVIAEEICGQRVNILYGHFDEHSGASLLLVAALYAVQIYADFSGYSNMAIGAGKVFGIRLRRNFDYPYFATSVGDFWRRWHMSLTSWFRDYVYIPLGGSRVCFARVIANTWIVFLLSGLWHGAAWTFVAWGAIHAALLTIEIVAKKLGLYRNVSRVGVSLRWFVSMFCVVLAWIPFRATCFSDAWQWFGGVFSTSTLRVPEFGIAALPWVFGFLLVEYMQRGKEHALVLDGWRKSFRCLAYAFVILLCVADYQEATEFIYFQF